MGRASLTRRGRKRRTGRRRHRMPINLRQGARRRK